MESKFISIRAIYIANKGLIITENFASSKLQYNSSHFQKLHAQLFTKTIVVLEEYLKSFFFQKCMHKDQILVDCFPRTVNCGIFYVTLQSVAW